MSVASAIQVAPSGVVIMDADRRIVFVTSVAEDLLGWRDEVVRGLACSVVFDCRDTSGASMCDRCGLSTALEQHEITPSLAMRVADPSGGRVSTSTQFWYLPPMGNAVALRLMAVIKSVPPASNPGTPGPEHRSTIV